MSQENVELLHQALDTFNRRDLDAYLALHDPGVEFTPYERAVEGRRIRVPGWEDRALGGLWVQGKGPRSRGAEGVGDGCLRSPRPPTRSSECAFSPKRLI